MTNFRRQITDYLAQPPKPQTAEDRFVGFVLAVGLAVIALAGAIYLIIDIARSGGV